MAKKRYLAPWGRAAEEGRAVEGSGPPDPEALAALEGKPAIYHCVSRIVWRELALGEPEKEYFVGLMRKWEAFCQVRILTFCVMTNHFHILVEVPERPPTDPTDEQLLDHLRLIYGGQKVAEIRWELERWREQENAEMAESLRQRFLRRMWDLSFFMKALKQAYSKWFNKRHGKKGNLWEERFRSLIVEDGHAARVVAGYIDLNPVRAGIAARPEEYRWSGWGEAVAGKRKAREGIRQVMLEREMGRSGVVRALRDTSEGEDVLAGYRELMAEDVGGRPALPEKATGSGRAGAGLLSEAEMLRRRVRYFVDGMVLGSKEFLEGVFSLTKPWFGEKRQSGARRLARAETPLRAMRALKVRAYD